MARDQWLDVEVRHLVALHAVSLERSFSGAAGRLGYVQSAISQQIAFLERVAGTRLVERSPGPGPVALTTAGRLVLHRVTEIMRQLDAAKVDLADLTSRAERTVRLGIGPGLLGRVLARVVALVSDADHDVLLDPHDVDDEDELLALLRDDRLDLALTELPPPSSAFVGETLQREPYVILAASGSSFEGNNERWPLPALARHRFVVPPATRSVGLVEEQFRMHGTPLRIAHRSGDAAAIAAWTRTGLTLALVPSREPRREWPGLVTVATQEPLPARQVGLLWRSDRPLSPAAAAIRDAAVRACRSPTRA